MMAVRGRSTREFAREHSFQCTASERCLLTTRAMSDDDLLPVFRRDGVVVFPGALTSAAVSECRAGLHADLKELGIDYAEVVAMAERGATVPPPVETALRRAQAHATGALPLYFSAWRLAPCRPPRIATDACQTTH